MIAFQPERRLVGRGAILIKDSLPARAAWIRSILLPFVERNAELLVSSQRPSLQRRSDILVLADPTAFIDETRPWRTAVAPLRYTLTEQAWETMSCTPRGAAVTVLSGGPGILSVLRDALDQLQRPDIQLSGPDDGIAGAGAWEACCHLRIRTREIPRTLERQIDAPVIAPGVIFNLARRLGRLDRETHQALREYLCSVAPVRADSEMLLDSVFEIRECLDTAASICGQLVLQLDDCDTVVAVSGPVGIYFDRRSDADILGRSIRTILPEWAMIASHSSGNEQHVSINGHAAVARVVRLARKPKRTLVTLARSTGLQGARGVARNRPATAAKHCLADIIGDSPVMEKARHLALRAGQSDSPILIVGESGTGKEMFAHAMHNVSRRASEPFMPINCAAIPESLIETELFGYEGGAFTSARREGRASLFERAHGGTLFLDELTDLSPHAQAALLRVLEEGMVTRVGGSRAVAVDVRVIGAANSPLEDSIIDGTFRRDLYHRLCVIPLWVPPLHQRRQDIVLLARHFLKELRDTRPLPDEVMDYLLRYRWPGNVRELQHCIRYMVTITDEAFTVADLPPHIQPYVQINDAQEEPKGSTSRAGNSPSDPMRTEGFSASALDESGRAILGLIERANHTGVVIGRRSLRDKAHQAGLALTERAVRSRLHALRADGLVEWGLGRSGVRLTAKGRSVRRQGGRL